MKFAAWQVALLVACVIVIGIIDWLTGPDVGFSLFYLAPITWAAWYEDRTTALALALLAAAFWLGADAAWHGINPVTLWNSFTRLGIYVAIAWLLARVRFDQRRLQDLNQLLQQKLEEEQQLARTDSLTGLPNRRMFVDELRRAVARSRRAGSPLAVALLDLEHLPQLNERLGRAAGDTLLRRVADVLSRYVRENDVAARLGGDEFGLLLDHSTEATARTTLERLLKQIEGVVGEVSSVAIGISIGAACFDRPPEMVEAALDHADAAMYCAKAKGPHEIYVVHFPAGEVSTSRS